LEMAKPLGFMDPQATDRLMAYLNATKQ